ncbi:hypothetical protein Syun_028102 [Stephania yunnanensis]|uniref:Uncharacterized protein n=1 Tax=Stephania yunnanensis TaxID=152371 RepID=A0AAP0EGR0_9MAGN
MRKLCVGQVLIFYPESIEVNSVVSPPPFYLNHVMLTFVHGLYIIPHHQSSCFPLFVLASMLCPYHCFHVLIKLSV